MTQHYLDMSDIADLYGCPQNTVKVWHRRAVARRQAGTPLPADLPAPDVIVGSRTQYAKPGWTEETIQAWLEVKRGSAA